MSEKKNLPEQRWAPPTSLGTTAARNLATTTKTRPQMQGITSRWLLRLLPWVETKGGVYRVNRQLGYTIGDGRVSFAQTGAEVRVIPGELRELPLLRDLDDEGGQLLAALADRFEEVEFAAGDLLAQTGEPVEHLLIIAHGRAHKLGAGKYDDPTVLDVVADGQYFGERQLVEASEGWPYTIKAITRCTVMRLEQRAFAEFVAQHPTLSAHVESFKARLAESRDERGQVEVAVGHEGEPELPSTFVDYELAPREYELSVAQTILRVHTRVADLYNGPMDQTEEQLRLTIEALRERQEGELINNRDFGLLHNAAFEQRMFSSAGPPTPDDFDDLLSLVWKEPSFFLAHPKAIAAFGRECNRMGLSPQGVDMFGATLPAWRGVPIFPCNKLPVSSAQTSSILLMRAGQNNQGVVGLRQTGLTDEVEPGVSVRFMNIDEKAVISYLVSTYYSAAVQVPDALAILADVDVSRARA